MAQDLREVIKLQMIATYNQLNKGKEETCVTLRNQIKEIDKNSRLSAEAKKK